jgi:eukaryotic-like serine/threonine-protein kinase
MEKTRQPGDEHSMTPLGASESDDADLSGQTLDDFKLLRRIGQGGMGQVYLAQQVSLRRQVALKILRAKLPDSAAASTSLVRFKAEAEAVARATHANIVQIYAIGQAAGHHFMALEYVEGRNLREFVEKRKPISVATGLRVMVQVAAALQRAGELNIIHRDIKPENILVGRAGEVKVADLGLSRCFDRPLSITTSGMAMGTPLYMSPEQVEANRPADQRSDIYSFGATCYFMFTGQPPFRGETPIEVAYQHVNKEPEPLAELCPDLPAELCAIIHKMMAKQPEARYQTAREIGRELARLGEKLRNTQTAIELAPNGVLADAPTVPAPRLSAAQRRKRWRFALAMTAFLAALLLGLGFGWYRNRSPAHAVVVPGDGDPSTSRASFLPRQREKALLKQVKDNGLNNQAGVNAAVELGLLYLNERRLDDASTFFKSLCPEDEAGCNGRLLGNLGKAMVLAFGDKTKESNDEFLNAFAHIDHLEKLQGRARTDAKQEIEVYHLLWKNTSPAAALREAVAEALYHNYCNDKGGFPEPLKPYLQPPRPAVKSGS